MNAALFRSTFLCAVVTLLATGLTARAYGANTEGVSGPEAIHAAALDTGEYDLRTAEYRPGLIHHVAGYYESWGGFYGPSPKLYATGEAMMLRVSSGTNSPMPVIDNLTQTATYLTTHSVESRAEPAYRFTAGLRLNDGLLIEASFFQATQWGKTASVADANSLRIHGDLGESTGAMQFYGMDSAALRSDTEIYNWELNGYMPLGVTDLSLLLGGRYVDFDETFSIAGVNTSAFPPFDQTIYDIRARNKLYGMQTGGRYKRDFGRIGLEFVGKAGMYANDGSRRSVISNGSRFFPNAGFPNSTVSETHVAFIGELGLSTTLQLTSWCWVKAGYNVMWIEGIARAANQLDFSANTQTTGTNVDFGSGAMIYGASLGLETRW